MSRRYDTTRRAESSAKTRRRIVEGAIELFGERGYTATTMVDLARTAGVSVATVHANGPKAALMQAAVEVASFGIEGERSVVELEAAAELFGVGTAEEFVAGAARLATELNRRTAAVWSALEAAADTDPDLAERRSAMLANMARAVSAMVTHCEARGWLRGAMPHKERAATLFILSSADSYYRATRMLGLDDDGYENLTRRGLEWALLGRV